MNLIIVCGAPASGKMTVGQELRKLRDYKLFFNHMSIDLVHEFFDFDTSHFRRLDDKIRFAIFEEIAKSDISGLVFTMVWDFADPEDEEYVDQIIDIFKDRNPKVCLVELNCQLEERLVRNKHENRLEHKPLKRDIPFSDSLLISAEKDHRMISKEGELIGKTILKIDNTHLSALEVAHQIITHFGLD